VLSTSKKSLCGPPRAPQPALLLRQTAAIFPPPVASPLALSPGDRIRKKSQSPAASSNIPGSTFTVVGLSRHGHQTARLVNVINHVLLYQFAHCIVGDHSIQVLQHTLISSIIFHGLRAFIGGTVCSLGIPRFPSFFPVLLYVKRKCVL
jgi:hypothetical protein